MSTVIDSLVLELQLDPTKFTKGQREALESFGKTQEAAIKGGKAIEEQSKKSMDGLGGLKSQALELFAVFTGAVGLKDFVSNTIQVGAALGRTSRAIGVSASEISKWQGAAREFGSTGEAMAQSFQSLSNVFTAWQVGGPEAPGIMQIFRIINTEAARLDAANARTIDGTRGVNEALKSTADNLKIIHDLSGDKNLASYLAQKIPGMDAGLFDLLIRGGEQVEEILKNVHGYTDAEAEAAGRVQRRWDGAKVAVENYGKTKLLATADAAFPLAHELFGKSITESKPWDAIFGWGEYADKENRPTLTKPSTDSEQNATSGRMASYRNAIASIESRGSGGYSALGPVTSNGDRALGRYQIMSRNLPEWSQAALGKQISVAEFMASPEMQDKIFDHRFGQYVRQFGNSKDAASAWFTGQPLSSGANRRDLYGTSGSSYAQRFAAALQGNSSTTTINITGTTINAGPNASASDIAAKLRDLGMKRQAEANQSSVGGQ